MHIMRNDTLMLSNTGASYFVRRMGAATIVFGVIIGTQSAVNANARPLTVGDYTGDHKTDITVFRPQPSLTAWYWLDSATGYGYGTYWGDVGDIPVSGDFSAVNAPDGISDLMVFRPSNNVWYWVDSVTGYGWSQSWGVEGDIPAVGDFDGDGASDITVWRPFPLYGWPAGTWYIINSHDWSVTAAQWGQAGDIPVPCDYDGDGKSDIAVYRPSNGTFYISRSLGGTTTTVLTPGAIPVPGNYDGDNRCDAATWWPYNGSWVYKSSYTGSLVGTTQGLNGDIPVPGDYDGDGRTDRVLWRPSTGNFFGYLSSTGGPINTYWGSGGPNNGGIGSDVPLPNYPGATGMIADVLVPQEQSLWCWAATSQMTAAYYGVGLSQCQLANVRSGRSDCCTNPASASDMTKCNVTGGWQDPLTSANFTFTDTGYHSGVVLTFAQLQTELNANRPVPFAWDWTVGGGHAMVAIKTWVPSPGAQWVSINSPLPVNVGDQVDMTYGYWLSASDHTFQQASYNVILH